MRQLVATMFAIAAFGLALPIGVLIAFWYLPVPRTWWSLTIFMISFWIPAAAAAVGVDRVRRLSRRLKDERSLRRSTG